MSRTGIARRIWEFPREETVTAWRKILRIEYALPAGDAYGAFLAALAGGGEARTI